MSDVVNRSCTCFTTTTTHAGDCPWYEPPTLFENEPTNPAEWEGYGHRNAAGHESPSTSVEAAKRIEPVSGRLRIMVYDAIRRAGSHGRTDDELEVELGMKHQTVSARRRELYLDAHIDHRKTAAGEWMKRNTRSGRGAFVFVAVAR